MTDKQVIDLPIKGTLDGTEYTEIQEAAGGAGSSKRATTDVMAARALAAGLAGLPGGSNTPIASTDTVLGALANLQAQIGAILAAYGVATGLATLDGAGKVPTSQLPTSVGGGMAFQALWDATSGAPSGSPAAGQFWVVNVAGTTSLSGIADWQVGDWAVFDGTNWDKIDNTDSVTSVAGLVGAITASALKTALAIAAGDVSGLATVAASGAYADLTGRPTVPAIGSSTPQPLGTAAAGTATDASASDHVHPLQTRHAGMNDQTGTTYTLVLTDAGKDVRCTNPSAITLTIPPNSSVAFAVDTMIAISQGGAGVVTAAPDSGVTLRAPNGAATTAQYDARVLEKTDTDEWRVW